MPQKDPEARREYNREANKRWYAANRVKRRKELAAKRREYRKASGELLLEYLGAHPCIDCGEKDPIVLEFDHRDRKCKRAAVAKLVGQGMTPAVVLKEIEKCDVRCANCHRRKTYRDMGHKNKG
jgi:hypothetical protein